MVMTSDKDGGLNPKNGIKIFPVVAAGDKELAELELKKQALFEEIKKAIQEQA